MNILAKQQIENIFEHRFNKENFSRFIINLLNKVEPNSSFNPLRGTYIKAPFQSGIQEYERVCKYIDSLGNQIDVLIVKLKDKSKLENARTFQRNFVVDYLNGGRGGKLKDGALVAFYTDDSPDWRFSFVKLEYELKEDNGKIKEDKKMTSARRYSFLVGENENSHTAQSQILPLLEEEEINPTLKQIEKVFEVETVTKEFFEKYKDLFLQVNSKLEEIINVDPLVKNDFENKDINAIDFTKKLLGQIVFLYFLQKKGWFGVPLDKKWGDGDKRFLRTLFEKSKSDNKNFFNDYLEPLFYEALAKERDDNYFSRFGCKIPFLNGGLFDPIGNYDWVNTNINISDDLFSSDYISQDKHKDKGTGILDVFDRYNFTVREDEPLEKEVAIDPEMLGKVFENMLEVKDRKSKGTYYTPREIVHYMCQESLINYLENHLTGKVLRENLVYLIKNAEYDKEKEQAGGEGVKIYETNSEFPVKIKENALEIDNLLKDIKVCDPAIGSGAFPVGMMNEIVKVRTILTQFIEVKENRTEYEFKRYAIANSLHGVDIDQSAVEIAKLRLWLSLIVDEDDIENIKPLPNLDYKIMQGNSLIEEFEGIKLFDDSLLKGINFKVNEITSLKNKQNVLSREFLEIYNDKSKFIEINRLDAELKQILKKLEELNKPKNQETNQSEIFMNIDEAKEKSEKLQKLQKRFFVTSQRSEKESLKIQIDDLIWDLIETTVKQEGRTEKLENITKIRKSKNKPFFLWKLNFAEVFKQKGGFDIVIGNPPYVGEKNNKIIFREIKLGSLKTYYQGKMDLFYFFFHLALNITSISAQITFITTNYWITATGASKLREDLQNRTSIREIINFNELRIFENALGQHNMITLLEKGKTDKQVKYIVSDKSGYFGNDEIIRTLNGLFNEKKQSEIFDNGKMTIVPSEFLSIINKFKSNSRLLGSNIANINSGADITISTITSKHISKFGSQLTKNEGVYVLKQSEYNNFVESSSKIVLKDFIKSTNITKFGVRKPTLKLIYLKWEDDISIYPEIKKHLSKFKRILSDQQLRYGEEYPWFALHRPREQRIFESSQKILVPYRSKSNIFGYTSDSIYSSRDVFYITLINSDFNLKYILALLNSKLYYIWLYFKGKRKGESLELYQKPLSEIPIKILDNDEQIKFVEIVNKIQFAQQAENYLLNENIRTKIRLLQKEIDLMVYKVFDLTNEEINLVEKMTRNLY